MPKLNMAQIGFNRYKSLVDNEEGFLVSNRSKDEM